MNAKMPVFAGLTCFVLSAASAASFDCRKAQTKMEKLICSDAETSRLDEILGSAYKKAYERADNKAGVKQSQRAWLSSYQLTSCSDIACLKKEFSDRIQILDEVSSPQEPTSKWTGNYVRYWKGKQDKDTAFISILGLRSARLFISGTALWYGPDAKNGQINDGEIRGYSEHVGQDSVASFDSDGCSARLALHEDTLEVTEESGCGGLNVSFNGQYRKK